MQDNILPNLIISIRSGNLQYCGYCPPCREKKTIDSSLPSQGLDLFVNHVLPKNPPIMV